MNNLTITRRALVSIWKQSQGCPTETGGALIGTSKIPIVLIAGESGAQAMKTVAMFTSDPDHDRGILLKSRARYGRQLVILGYWHKHPQGMRLPSAGDLSQARDLLTALQSAGEPDPFIVCIIAQNGETPEQSNFPYILRPGMEQFTPLSFHIIPDDHSDIDLAMRQETIFLHSDRSEHPWSDPEFVFHETPAGHQRLKREIEQLRECGWQVIPRLSQSANRVLLEVQKSDAQLLIRLPPEFPINAPCILDRSNGQKLVPLGQPLLWNSDLSLALWLTGLVSNNEAGFVEPTKPIQTTAFSLRSMRLIVIPTVLIYLAGYVTSIYLHQHRR